MARKRQLPVAEQPEPEPIGSAVEQVVQQAQERQPGEDAPEPKQEWKPSYSGEIRVLEDGTKAHYRRYGNKAGATVHFEFPHEGEKPEPGVTEPLKEAHEGRERYSYNKPRHPKKWHHPIGEENPIGECLDAEQRFGTAVERLAESRRKGKGGEPEIPS